MTPAKLQPHQERVVSEHDELNDKCGKLRAFINSNPIFPTLAEAEQMDLLGQIVVMEHYRTILKRRIDRF